MWFCSNPSANCFIINSALLTAFNVPENNLLLEIKLLNLNNVNELSS